MRIVGVSWAYLHDISGRRLAPIMRVVELFHVVLVVELGQIGGQVCSGPEP